MTMHRVLTGAPRTTPASYREHLATFGELPLSSDVTKELLASGVTGHGGAAFPTGKKVDHLKNQRQGVQFVVVNAMEGEPASMKDRVLLSTNPHLVIDGAVALADSVGADQVIICVPRDRPKLSAIVQRAIDERPLRHRRDARIELQNPPGRYVAGEESALVHWLNDKETLPQYRPTRPAILRIGRSATLVDNAETCAHVGLIARYGAQWFRQVGTANRPGTALVTVSGAVAPSVTEVPYGTPISEILRGAGVDAPPSALLLAGFGGMWIPGAEAHRGFDDDSLRPLKATTGAGIIVALPERACGIRETARIVRWMAAESARQCGPCAFGLPALADDLEILTSGRRAEQALSRLSERCSVIDGRGACRHPDGVVRLVRSALDVFATDAVRHANGHPCAFATSTVVHVPATQREEELEWQ